MLSGTTQARSTTRLESATDSNSLCGTRHDYTKAGCSNDGISGSPWDCGRRSEDSACERPHTCKRPRDERVAACEWELPEKLYNRGLANCLSWREILLALADGNCFLAPSTKRARLDSAFSLLALSWTFLAQWPPCGTQRLLRVPHHPQGMLSRGNDAPWNLECPDSNYSKFPEALRTVLNRRFPPYPEKGTWGLLLSRLRVCCSLYNGQR
jgi:hypothetical protein